MFQEKKLTPLKNNHEKMRYARRASNIRPGFILAADHAVLQCEYYEPPKKLDSVCYDVCGYPLKPGSIRGGY